MGSFTKETQSLRLILIYNDYICFKLFYYYVKLSVGELFQSLQSVNIFEGFNTKKLQIVRLFFQLYKNVDFQLR